jgi:hypothetical protein
MNVVRRCGSTAALTCLLALRAVAAEYSLPLTDDAYIHGLYPTMKTGSAVSLNVHTYGPMYSLVRFDPAAIVGLTISKATLTLYPRSLDSPGNMTIHPILSSWSEGTVTWGLQPPSEATAAANFDITNAGFMIAIDVTGVVQRWANGTLAHAGLLLKSPTVKKAYFDSKERSGGFAATLHVTTGGVADSARILDLSNASGCVIDEPGVYVLDRDWYFSPYLDKEPNARCGSVSIRSEGVTIDMRGFSLECGDMWTDSPLVTIDTAGNVSLRDGRIRGKETALRATVAALQPWQVIGLSRVAFYGDVELGNRNVTVDGGGFSSQRGGISALTVGAGSEVRNARFDCYQSVCVYANGTQVELVQNVVAGDEAPALVVNAASSLVAENVIRVQNASAGAILVSGSNNVIARNYVSDTGVQGGSGILGIRVENTGNVLDGNIVTRMATGIWFTQTGNFYGNNRVSAPTPFAGTDGQIDWGGNVSF